VLSPAQVALLQACTRVLVTPARVVMTGRVSPDAEAAIRGQATAAGERMLDAMAQVAQVGYFARRLARRRLMRQEA